MRKLICGIALMAGFVAYAQDSLRVLTLNECMDMALARNLTIKQNQNSLLGAQSNKRQAYYNFLTNLNAQGGYTYFDGNNIDFTGQVVSNTSRSSNPAIFSNMDLFNAFANHHLLRQRRNEFESARYQLEDSKIAIKATVLRNYLSVLVDTENVKISDQRLEFLVEQLNREKKRLSVGVGSPETVYNFQSQVANERLNNVNLNNQYQSDLLALLQSIQIESYANVAIAPLNFGDLEVLIEYDDYNIVLAEILAYSFSIKSADASQDAANSQLKQSRSNRYPSITASASHFRRYTSEATPEFIDQLRSTPSDQIGATITIPIFNRYQTQNDIDNSKVAYLNSQIQTDQAVLNVTNAAQRDYLDLVAAQTSYQTAQENFEALNQTFEFIKKRFETGNTDFYSYLESLNNKNRAEAQLVNAKYTIVLRKQILELYRGK